jgi:hypothetical protein
MAQNQNQQRNQQPGDKSIQKTQDANRKKETDPDNPTATQEHPDTQSKESTSEKRMNKDIRNTDEDSNWDKEADDVSGLNKESDEDTSEKNKVGGNKGTQRNDM